MTHVANAQSTTVIIPLISSRPDPQNASHPVTITIGVVRFQIEYAGH